jgi:DNA-binding MarR family transcriptional regulator
MFSSRDSLKYLKFLHLVEALRKTPTVPLLDTVEERLLSCFAAAWCSGKKTPVTEAARMVPDISERTVFRRLKTLEKKGLLAFIKSADDARIRFAVPTQKTENYFDKVGQCIEQAQGDQCTTTTRLKESKQH